MTLRFNSRLLAVLALAVTALVFSSLLVVSAQESDGRINTRDHVGGAAVYCVDEQFLVANDWHDGGIRVLDGDGQVLLEALAADIIAAGDPPEETVQVGSGANAYGSLELYYRPDSKFQLHGNDDHGKPFIFVWQFCGSLAGPELPGPTQAPALPTATLPAPTPEVTAEPTVSVEPTSCPILAMQPAAQAVAPAAVVDPCAQDN